MAKRTIITTSIPYVNASPHIGYSLEVTQADTFTRWHKLQNIDTYFLAGSDENAIKNVEAAEKLGLSTQELVDKNAQAFLNLKTTLNLTFDQFIRTSSSKHKQGAQRLWELCNKDIYKKTYTGLYCTGCETFYKDGEFKDNICPYHNRKLEVISEENYFFALSKYSDHVRELIQNDTIKIFPAHRKQEVLNFISKGLEDFSISRPLERTKGWGIPVPGDSSQRMYVWFDALTNYITALDFATDGELYQRYWKENQNRFQIIGKDIIKFHAIYWPAMLLSARQPLPTRLYVHGFINVEGKKMSKSIGNVVDPFKLVETYGTDAVRYYLLREIPSLDDGDFSHDRMLQIYNTDLANELGNLVLRITTLAEKDQITVPTRTPGLYDKTYSIFFEQFQFNLALEKIWGEIKELNREIDGFAPWKHTADERRDFLLASLEKIWDISQLLLPFLPSTATQIAANTHGEIHKISPLFPRLK